MPFREERFILFPPAAVGDAMADGRRLPEWRRGVILRADTVETYDRRRVGVAVRAHARGFLPYRLRFTVGVTGLERPRFGAVKTVADLTSTGW